MRNPILVSAVLGMVGMALTGQTNVLAAGEGAGGHHLFRLTGLFSKSRVDLRSYECDECGQDHGPNVECIVRVPVTEIVTGKKKVYKSKIRYEYVSIPEVRYRWKKKWVTKEIDSEYDKPVCKSEDGKHCYGTERWDADDIGGSKLHCRTIEPQFEKVVCKYCDYEPGKTTIKVRYKTCVKEPYTVYRQVKRQVCVKQPCYEKVEVPITRHECCSVEHETCEKCGGAGCSVCHP